MLRRRIISTADGMASCHNNKSPSHKLSFEKFFFISSASAWLGSMFDIWLVCISTKQTSTHSIRFSLRGMPAFGFRGVRLECIAFEIEIEAQPPKLRCQIIICVDTMSMAVSACMNTVGLFVCYGHSLCIIPVCFQCVMR